MKNMNSTQQPKPVALGENQEIMLRALAERRAWYGGCGYAWGTYSATVRIMESLVKRGLAAKAEQQAIRRGLTSTWTEYRPTPAGIARAAYRTPREAR